MHISDDFVQLIDDIHNEKSNGKFENYIEYIQFPCYKSLSPNTKIDFTFPLTMLVGKNGTGKSSVLHAIYGAPKGTSTGDYWFSTSVDPIEEGKNKYFYGYTTIKNGESVLKEVLKKRQPSKKAPDYWETDRHNVSLGMKEDSDLDSETRNNPVPKNVIYFDFRGELSAFDKYFHFYKSKNDSKVRKNEIKLKDAKNYIRKNSKYLKMAFEGEKVCRPRYPQYILNEDLQIIDNNNYRECLEIINYILGKNYSEIKYVYHRIYESWGTSIMLKTQNGIQYSEANAGSGESAVIQMVCTIMKAKQNSLILLDEPEVSLHPGAQKRLKLFLLNVIKRYHHQIIISTHSTVLIDQMPPESLKLLEMDNAGSVNVTNDVYYTEAFVNIKEEINSKYLILCEDFSAQVLIKAMLKQMKIDRFFSVEYRYGGASTLFSKHLPILAIDEIYDNVFIILDGDKSPERVINYSDIPSGDIDNIERLEYYIKNLTSDNCLLDPLVDGEGGKSNSVQKIEIYKKYLKYAENHLFYLPDYKTPEQIVLSSSVVKEKYDNYYVYPYDNNSKPARDNAKEAIKKIGEVCFTSTNIVESAFDMLTTILMNNDSRNDQLTELKSVLNKIYKYCNEHKLLLCI